MFDLARTDEQRQLIDAVRSMLTRECPTDRVRASEDAGHDPALWKRCLELSLVEMALPGSALPGSALPGSALPGSALPGSALPGSGLPDGGATLLDVAFVAELLGEFLAPVPLVEAVVATRLLARLDEPELLAAAISGEVLLSFAPRPPLGDRLDTVPAGALAHHVIFSDGGALRLTTDPVPARPAPNLGGLPVADRSTAGSRELVSGPEAVALYAAALAEWKSLVAAQLVGSGRRALRLGIDYASEREAFGAKVASFQAIAHRLADVATDLDAAQLLSWEAAWSHDGRPSDSAVPNPGQLASMALILATDAAATATRESLHVFGGYGFMLEYDIQLYFRRVKATTLLVGDVSREPEHLADLLWSGGS